MLNEEVRNIMSLDPTVVSPEDSIRDVSSKMAQEKLQQLPVVKDGKLVGLVTVYDLWKNSITSEKDNVKVSEIMNQNVLVIAPKDKVGTAAELFIDRRFKTLPVVNLRNELKGVITSFDVIKHVFKKEYPVPILYKEVLEAS